MSATEPASRGDRRPVAGRDGERGMGERRREAPRAPGSAVPSPEDLDALEVAVRRYSEKAGLAGIGSGQTHEISRLKATLDREIITTRGKRY